MMNASTQQTEKNDSPRYKPRDMMENQKTSGTDYIAISTSNFDLKPAIQSMANQKYNGNLSLMAVDLLTQGMEAERMKPKEGVGTQHEAGR